MLKRFLDDAALVGRARQRVGKVLRAAQEVGLPTVPVIIRTANDLEVLELSLIENLQRADLNPIEEAQGYVRLANEFGMRQEDIALKVGRSRAAVANANSRASADYGVLQKRPANRVSFFSCVVWSGRLATRGRHKDLGRILGR